MIGLSAGGLACLMKNGWWQLNLFVLRPPKLLTEGGLFRTCFTAQKLATESGVSACTRALTFAHPQYYTCVLGVSFLWLAFLVLLWSDFPLWCPELLAPWYKTCIHNKDSPNWSLACISKGQTCSFPGNCVLSCAEVPDDSDCVFKMQPASSMDEREAFWSGIYRDAPPWVFFFLALISMETACPSSPSVLAAYSSLKSSLMKDGSLKVHKFDLHSHSKFEYPSEFLWPGNQVRDAVRLCPHGRFLWINLSLSLSFQTRWKQTTKKKKNALLFLFSLFHWSYQSIVTTV